MNKKAATRGFLIFSKLQKCHFVIWGSFGEIFLAMRRKNYCDAEKKYFLCVAIIRRNVRNKLCLCPHGCTNHIYNKDAVHAEAHEFAQGVLPPGFVVEADVLPL